MASRLLVFLFAVIISGVACNFWYTCKQARFCRALNSKFRLISGPGYPSPQSVSSANCNGNTCTVARGQNITFTVVAVSTGNYSTVTIDAYATVLGLKFYFMQNEDSCPHITPSCPYVAGVTYTLTLTATAPNFSIHTNVTSKLKLNSCFSFN